MRPSKVQKQAMYLSQRLRKQQMPEGGMLLYDAVVQCQLDGSAESIERLDSMFVQMYQRNITIQKILEKPNHANFLLTIAVYIGDYIGQLLDEIPKWSSLESTPVFTDDSEVTFEFSYSLVAQYRHGFAWPLTAIKAALSQKLPIKDYIQQVTEQLINEDKVNLNASASDIFNQYLKKVRTGKLIDNTMAYHHLLKNIEFNFSYESLEQIDRVLKLIKAYEALNVDDYEQFSKDSQRKDFIYFLGCYLASTTAKLAKTLPNWANYNQIQALQNKSHLTKGFEFNQAVRFGEGQWSFPLLAITNALFEKFPTAIKGTKEYADDIIQKNSSTLSSYPFLRNPITLSSSKYIPATWTQAATLAGILAAKCLASVSERREFEPTSITMNNGEIGYIHHEEEIEKLLTGLEVENLDNPWRILAHHIDVNLPTGCTDGIGIEIRVYGDLVLNLQFILPYRPANNYLGFAIYPLFNYRYSCPADCLPALAQAFYEGAKQVKDPSQGTDYWMNYYINKHDLYAPAEWLSQPITTFDPKDSAIEILPLWE